MTFEPRHENKSCSACPEDQLKPFYFLNFEFKFSNFFWFQPRINLSLYYVLYNILYKLTDFIYDVLLHSIAGCFLEYQTKYSGDSVGTFGGLKSIKECMDWCKQNSVCKFWSYNSKLKQCKAQSSNAKKEYDDYGLWISGPRICAGTRNILFCWYILYPPCHLWILTL